jgi:lipoprotein-anchoring transpeptidase ErfK/SrfK
MRGFFVACLASACVVAGWSAVGASAGRQPGDPVYAATPRVGSPPKPGHRAKPAPPPPPPPRVAIRPRVSIAGVRVGFLDRTKAADAVTASFRRPLTVVVDGAVIHLHPARLATPYLDSAVAHAWSASPGTSIGLVVSVHGSPVRDVAERIARRFDRRSADASVALVGDVPRITRDRVGHRLDKAALVAGIVHALAANDRAPLRFATTRIDPAVTTADLGPVILINRGINRLTWYAGTATREFPVATGQAIYPTPAGRFHIVVKWKDPWWYPPTYDSWAAGLKPVPPGPGNPLGTRWMGLSAPGVGIHGTDEPGSIGYSASHGCIRMQVPDAEWLFDHVNVGTTVFIV